MAKLKAPDVFETGVPKGAKAKGSTTPGVLSGQLGTRYDGKVGETQGTQESFLPLVTFDGVRTVNVQLWQQSGELRDPVTTVPTPDLGGFFRAFNFDAATEEEDPGGPESEHIRLGAEALFISKTALSPGFDFATEYDGATNIKVDGGNGYFFVPIGATTEHAEYWEVAFSGSFIGVWPPPEAIVTLTPMTPQPDAEVIPNASARALVRLRAGQTGEIEFECDWEGQFSVLAQSIEIERKSFAPNYDGAYVDATVRLTAALSLVGQGHSPFAPQYTEPPVPVASGELVTFALPQFARRVSLLLKYDSGDAPLAQILIAFATPYSGSQGFIDALSARASLFGDGMPIPHGANAIRITNSSAETLKLGAIFHLGL